MPQAELLWASVREVLNIFQANDCGCEIVTVPHDILNKALKLAGMDLKEMSLDTVKMFAADAKAAGFNCKFRVPKFRIPKKFQISAGGLTAEIYWNFESGA